jgi:TRAP-type C4-dicarboxylate transport system substrate-binding protein
MKFLKLLAAPVFAGLLFMAGTANAAKVTMNIGYSVNEGHPYGTFMNLFAERFQTLSGGTVRVKVHCCHKMGSEQEQFKKTPAGHARRNNDRAKQCWAIFPED